MKKEGLNNYENKLFALNKIMHIKKLIKYFLKITIYYLYLQLAYNISAW